MRMTLAILLSSVVVLTGVASCKPQEDKVAAAGAPDAANGTTAQATAMTEEDKSFYSLGALMSRSIKTFELTPKELDSLKQGLTDGITGAPLKADPDKYRESLQQLQQTRLAAAAKKQAEVGAAYLANAATEAGATKTASGIVIKELKAGTGPNPKATDSVKVHYHGTLTDGTVFDSSVQRGEPVSFPLSGVIPCWTEAVQTIKVGGKSRIVCPAALAYGDRGSPPTILPGSTLIFEVELLGIEKPESPAKAAKGSSPKN